MTDRAEHDAAKRLLAFIDDCPSPWHAGYQMVRRVLDAGGEVLHEDEPWSLRPGGFYVVERGQSSVIAFRVGHDTNQSRALAQGVPLTLTPAQSPLPVTVRKMGEAIWQRVTQE